MLASMVFAPKGTFLVFNPGYAGFLESLMEWLKSLLGLSGVAFFMAIVLPVGLAFAASFFLNLFRIDFRFGLIVTCLFLCFSAHGLIHATIST